MIGALRITLIYILDIYWYVVIASVISSWLTGFGIINSYNPFARAVLRALYSLTEPVFGKIRGILPNLGGLDLSPLIVLLLMFFLRNWLAIGSFL